MDDATSAIQASLTTHEAIGQMRTLLDTRAEAAQRSLQTPLKAVREFTSLVLYTLWALVPKEGLVSP